MNRDRENLEAAIKNVRSVSIVNCSAYAALAGGEYEKAAYQLLDSQLRILSQLTLLQNRL